MSVTVAAPRRNDLDRHQRDILLTVLAEVEVFAEVPEEVIDSDDPRIASMIGKGVPYTPAAWFKEPLSDAQRKALSRAARRLETQGLMRRITEPNRNRVTHLRLTWDGLQEACRLAPEADQAATREGLCRTAWGRDLLDDLHQAKPNSQFSERRRCT